MDVFGVNGDNNLDIISGPFWYEGHSFVERYGEYWNGFSITSGFEFK